MKQIVFLMFILFSSFAKAEDITVKVFGMSCGLCAEDLTKNFKKTGNILDAVVDLKEFEVRLKTKDGKKIEDGEIKSILISAGYNVESIVRKP